VLGIDPGLRVTGYGLVSEIDDKLSAVEFGAIKSDPSQPLTERLFGIVEVIAAVVEEFKPHCASVEQVFAAANIKTALLLGHVRGAIVTELRRHDLSIFEYSALEIKQATVGYGRAQKHQVAEMCRLLLGLDETPSPPDAADALAAAICHLHSRRSNEIEMGVNR
jgi:crossover junction endodeoxyribonuclease RuvC